MLPKIYTKFTYAEMPNGVLKYTLLLALEAVNEPKIFTKKCAVPNCCIFSMCAKCSGNGSQKYVRPRTLLKLLETIKQCLVTGSTRNSTHQTRRIYSPFLFYFIT